MRKGLIAAGLLFVFGAAQAAPPACFTAAEIEAEQAFLFKTELMVVADACRDASYVTFLKRNRDSIVHYQNSMMERFRRVGEKRPEAALDTYLTKLANQSSLRNGSAPVSLVCEQAAQLFTTANTLSNRGFREYAAEKAH